MCVVSRCVLGLLSESKIYWLKSRASVFQKLRQLRTVAEGRHTVTETRGGRLPCWSSRGIWTVTCHNKAVCPDRTSMQYQGFEQAKTARLFSLATVFGDHCDDRFVVSSNAQFQTVLLSRGSPFAVARRCNSPFEARVNKQHNATVSHFAKHTANSGSQRPFRREVCHAPR